MGRYGFNPTKTQTKSEDLHGNATRGHIDVYNIYRPPTRQSEDGERVDLFTMDAFPTSPNVFAMGDINGHHPEWDVTCSDPDGVGRRVHEWLAANQWTTLNSGAATCVG